MRKFLLYFALLLILFSVDLSASEVQWGYGNILEINFQFRSDLPDSPDYYLTVIPFFKYYDGTLFSAPYFNVVFSLYRGSNLLTRSEFHPCFVNPEGYLFYAKVDESFTKIADKLEIKIRPWRNIIKSDDFEDSKSLFDEGFKVTLYGISLTKGVSYDYAKIDELGEVYFPWEMYDDLISKVNVIKQADGDTGKYLEGDIGLLKERLGHLTPDQQFFLTLAENFVYRDPIVSRLFLKVLSYSFWRMFLENIPDDYYDVDKMWIWGKGFNDFLNLEGLSDLWDSDFVFARNRVLSGLDPVSYLLDAEGLLHTAVAERYYSEITSSNIDYLNALHFFFQFEAEEEKFSFNDWTNAFESYSKEDSAPAYYFFDYWFFTIDYVMKKIESGEEYYSGFLDSYVNEAGKWVFEKLGGDKFSDFENQYGIWKNAVMSKNYHIAQEARDNLEDILREILSYYGG